VTTALKQPLVEVVAEAIRHAPTERLVTVLRMDGDVVTQERVEFTVTDESRARAALDACHAEELAEALRNLLEDTQHRNHGCGDTPENCPVLAARALLAKLDGKP
jgi:thiamine pyrophosphate-dependent acetolactate synthase large subunit-like protein